MRHPVFGNHEQSAAPEEPLLGEGCLLLDFAHLVEGFDEHLLDMEFVNDALGIGKVLGDAGEVGPGHVARDGADRLAGSSALLQFPSEGGDDLFLSALFHVNDTSSIRVDEDCDIVVATKPGGFIDGNLLDLIQFSPQHGIVHPVGKNGFQ